MPIKVAAAYIRVSTEDQLEYSPESQLRVIRDYAGRNGFTLPEEYIFMDEGISGRKAEKRPAFMRMIAVAKTTPKPFDAILLWKFSRFARSRQDSIVYKSMLRKQLGIEVLSVSESLGDDKISILIEAIIEAMDEYYSINLAEEVRRGMTEKAHRGEPLSVAPFGYRLNNKMLIPVHDEAEVIVSVFEQYAGGSSTSHIAKTLNRAGVITHRGGKIEGRTVEYWLNNPVYIGKIRWTPTGRIDRDFHSPDSIVANGRHEPIVSDELWQRVQLRLSYDRSSGSRTTKKDLSHWLVGLVSCGICGRPMVNCRGYFYCSGRSKGLCAGGKGFNVEAAADMLLSVLQIFFRELSPVFPILHKDYGHFSDRLLDNAFRRLQRLRDSYAAGIDSLDEYRIEKSKIMSEIDSIKKDPVITTGITGRPQYVNDVFSVESFSNEQKNSVLRSFVRRIILTNDEMTAELFY